jgi:serine/threonine protein kinase
MKNPKTKEELEKIDFFELLEKIQPCINIDEDEIDLYLSKVFDDLALRAPVKGHITKLILNSYLDIPLFISDKIFNFFSRGGKLLQKENFTAGMKALYFEKNLNNLMKTIFSIFNTANDGIIHFEDFLKYLPFLFICTGDEESKEYMEVTDDTVYDFFNGEEGISLNEFEKSVLNRSSNLFILILILLYRKQPFNCDAIQLYNSELVIINGYIGDRQNKIAENKRRFSKSPIKISSTPNSCNKLSPYNANLQTTNMTTLNSQLSTSKSISLSNKILVQVKMPSTQLLSNNQLQSFIYPPTKFVKNYISTKYNLFHEEEKSDHVEKSEESNFISPYGLNRSMTITQVNSSTNLKKDPQLIKLEKFQKLKKDLKHTSGKDKINFEITPEYSSRSINEKIIYKFQGEGSSETILIYKVLIKHKHIYSYMYSISKNKYFLENIHPLYGVIPAKCDEIEINKKIYHSLALLPKYGSSLTNIEHIFLLKSREDLEELYDILIHEMEFKDFSDVYKLDQVIGSGKFSKVYISYDETIGILSENHSKQKFAIKAIEKLDLEEEVITLIRNEIYVCKFLKTNYHQSIIKVIDIYEDRLNIYIVMEYCEGGNLKNYVNIYDPSENVLKSICKQISTGLLFLNRFGIIHRDIKLENILIKNDSKSIVSVISDFGFSVIQTKKDNITEPYGSLLYSAPELIRQTGYDCKIDIWSFGVVINFLLTKSFPFDGTNLNKSELSKKILKDELKFPVGYINVKARDLINQCLKKNPVDRISVEDLWLSEWLSSR